MNTSAAWVTPEDIDGDDAMSSGSIHGFIESFPQRSFQKGQPIIQPDMPIDHIYCISRGFVRGFDINDNGDSQVIWYGRPDDIFPLPRIFDDSYQTDFFYDAFTDCEVRTVPAKQFADFLEADNGAMLQLGRYLAEENTDTSRRLHALAEPKAHDKVLRILDFFGHRFARASAKDTTDILLPLTHQDIANFVGLTRETVSHELAAIRDVGLIEYDKTTISLNRVKLSEELDS